MSYIYQIGNDIPCSTAKENNARFGPRKAAFLDFKNIYEKSGLEGGGGGGGDWQKCRGLRRHMFPQKISNLEVPAFHETFLQKKQSRSLDNIFPLRSIFFFNFGLKSLKSSRSKYLVSGLPFAGS